MYNRFVELVYYQHTQLLKEDKDERFLMDFWQILPSEDKTDISYEDATPLLHFLDKYATGLIWYRIVALFYKLNHDKTLLDKLTMSGIAYSILMYKNSTFVSREDAKIQIETPLASRSERLKIPR